MRVGGAAKGTSQDMLGAPACRQALGEKFYFCFDGPTGLSLNKGTRVQPWPAHFVHLLLQPEAGKELGSRRKGGACYSHKRGVRWRQPSPQCIQPCLCKYSGRTAGQTLGADAQHSPQELPTSSPGPQRSSL